MDGEIKYLESAGNLVRPERNTLLISFEDLDEFNNRLANMVLENYYRSARLCELSSGHAVVLCRVYPFLCYALRNFVNDHKGVNLEKELFIAFENVPTRLK